MADRPLDQFLSRCHDQVVPAIANHITRTLCPQLSLDEAETLVSDIVAAALQEAADDPECRQRFEPYAILDLKGKPRGDVILDTLTPVVESMPARQMIQGQHLISHMTNSFRSFGWIPKKGEHE